MPSAKHRKRGSGIFAQRGQCGCESREWNAAQKLADSDAPEGGIVLQLIQLR